MRSTWLAILPLAVAATSLGCDAIKFQGVVKTQRTTADGRVVTTEKHSDNLDDFMSDVGDAADEMSAATAEMIKTLTDVPPPGKVELAHIVPELTEDAADPDVNHLLTAKKKDGTPQDFQYVRIGVPSYDEFFKAAAELHALMVFSSATLKRSKELSVKVLGDGAGEGEKAGELAKKATVTATATGKAEASALLKSVKAAKATAAVAKGTAEKIQKLVATGQQLIAGAPSSITNPKVALHIDLIVKGLEESVGMITASGEHLGEMAGEMATF